MQGGVIDYETNLKTGGMGARSLGIGASRQYREDVVTVSLRTVSVNTGEILIEVLVTKKILSVGISTDYFKFIELGTQLVEVEVGSTTNESMAIALQKAIETAVLETIYEGKTKRYWSF
jgi:curli production assembly/transport component CsgG